MSKPKLILLVTDKVSSSRNVLNKYKSIENNEKGKQTHRNINIGSDGRWAATTGNVPWILVSVIGYVKHIIYMFDSVWLCSVLFTFGFCVILESFCSSTFFEVVYFSEMFLCLPIFLSSVFYLKDFFLCAQFICRWLLLN